MSSPILIGCPILHREWILPAWFKHVRDACDEIDLEPEFVFVMDPERDPKTHELILALAPDSTIVVESDGKPDDRRDWGTARFRRMVVLRNLLMAKVRELGPDLFLSLDSDVLLAPTAIEVLLPLVVEEFDAAGGKCYLYYSGVKCPSYAKLVQNSLKRSNITGVHKVDVIMAIKLMTPAAYAVDYKLHVQGEDTGWAINCKNAGLRLGYCGDVVSKHVMRRWMLDRVDERVGW